MTTRARRTADADGQLLSEFRGRDLSGLPFFPFFDLSRLLDDIGAPSWACGPTAAALRRFDGFVLRPPFHVLTLRDRNVRRLGHVIHTTEDLPVIDRGEVCGLPAVTATRALIELAATLDRERLTIAVDSALRDGLTCDDFLHRRICGLRSSGRYGIPKLLEVIEGSEIIRGGHSWLEREFLRLLHDAALPRPKTQQVLGRRGTKLIRVDFRFEGTPVVVEVLGYRWHRSGAEMNIDAQRINRLVLDGYVPLQFTYERVVSDGESASLEVREALRRHLPGFV